MFILSFYFSSLLLKDWNVSIIIFINIKFRTAKIILLKCRPHQAKKRFFRYSKQLEKIIAVVYSRIRK